MAHATMTTGGNRAFTRARNRAMVVAKSNLRNTGRNVAMLPKSLISADSHVVERAIAFRDIDPKFRDRAPSDVTLPNGGAAVMIEGMFAVGYGQAAAAGLPPERIGKPMPWDQVNPAAYDSGTRLDVQDQDGVSGEVIFPSVGMFLHGHPDVDFGKACLDAYNRWLVEFCSRDPDRLIGVAQIPLRTIDEGIKELEEAKAAGFRTVMLPGEPLYEDYDHPDYDALWEAAVDLGLPINFHILTSRRALEFTTLGKNRGPSICNMQRFVRGNQDIVMLFVFGGVFERHPKLKIVAVESDVSWLPHMISRMDTVYPRYRFHEKTALLSKQPSEYVADHVYLTMQDDYPVARMTDILPMKRVLWANDFPHGDAIWPRSREVLGVMSQHMSDEHMHMMVHDNVAELYGLTI
jgi:predicted TIM-barrel fold metal-dependent hydrolase